DEATDCAEGGAGAPGALANSAQPLRRVPRVTASPPADVDAQLPLPVRQSSLERPDRAGGDSGRVPVLAHQRAEGLKPERMREPSQKLGAAVVQDDRLDDNACKSLHSL